MARSQKTLQSSVIHFRHEDAKSPAGPGVDAWKNPLTKQWDFVHGI